MKKIYLLRGRGVPAFKIGVSSDVYYRSLALRTEIDWGQSFEIEAPEGNAHLVERMLLHLFGQFRFEMRQGSGFTEWVELEKLDEILRFLSYYRSNLRIGEVVPFRESPLSRALRKSKPIESPADRLKRLDAARARRIQHAGERNKAAYIWCESIFAGMREDGSLYGMVRPARPGEDGYLYILGPNKGRWCRQICRSEVATSNHVPVFADAVVTNGSIVQLTIQRLLVRQLNLPRAFESVHPGFREIRDLIIGLAVSNRSRSVQETHILFKRSDFPVLKKWQLNRFS
jgi:hypothetical protein